MKYENKADLIADIENIIVLAEKMRRAYFYTPDSRAVCRRYYEEKHSTDKVEWEEGGCVFAAQFITECSCKHVYAKGCYTRNGERTTLTAIKNSLKRLKEA